MSSGSSCYGRVEGPGMPEELAEFRREWHLPADVPEGVYKWCEVWLQVQYYPRVELE